MNTRSNRRRLQAISTVLELPTCSVVLERLILPNSTENEAHYDEHQHQAMDLAVNSIPQAASIEKNAMETLPSNDLAQNELQSPVNEAHYDEHQHQAMDTLVNSEISDQTIQNGNRAGDSSSEQIDIKGQRVDYKMVPSRRINQMLLYDNKTKQTFKKNKKYAEKTAYTCCVDRCPSRIIRHNNGQCFYSSDYKPHNHVETAEQTVAINEFKKTLKQKGSNLNYLDKLPTLRSLFQETASE